MSSGWRENEWNNTIERKGEKRPNTKTLLLMLEHKNNMHSTDRGEGRGRERKIQFAMMKDPLIAPSY